MRCSYLGRVGCHLGCLGVVPRCKQGVELAGEQLLSAGQVVADSHAESQVWVLQHVGDVGNDVLLLHTHRQHLGKQEAATVRARLEEQSPDCVDIDGTNKVLVSV